jgi:DNA-3-methyladenine glycosylase
VSRRLLPRSFYRRPSTVVAPELLNKVLVSGRCGGRIVEVEAYAGPLDPASHAYKGRTARNATMFGPPGHLYVYFTYGMHFCANVVTGEPEDGQAVLLRALAPLDGIAEMRGRRPAARRLRDLANGPAKLTLALGIERQHDGTDLTSGVIRIVDDGTPPPERAGVSPRVGITRAADLPWRWFVPGDPNVSRPPRPTGPPDRDSRTTPTAPLVHPATT